MGTSVREDIINGKTVLGIELGSTRIKAILIGKDNNPIASGEHGWENRLENGIWTYSLEDIWTGLTDAYARLAADVRDKYQTDIENIGAIGFSAMMHGYMPFNKEGELLVPFRTWRNTITGEASKKLTEIFGFHIPQRWSIAHLYQAILNKEEHIKDIDFITTLEGYIHWQLSGEKVIGVGEASGMFPIDMNTKDYNATMVAQFDELIASENLSWKLKNILPKSLVAGEKAGVLTEEGARKLDPSGKLKAGVLMCPPEGDAGTGMVCTNAIAPRTGNVSAGTSIFGMVVLEKDLQKAYDEIDVVTTPTGLPVAMAHCNNCTSDLNAWAGIFKEFAECFGIDVDMNKLYETLYKKSLEGDADCGGLMSYNYFSGEHITGFEEGRPLFVRSAESKFNLANFMRANLYSAMGVLKVGFDILLKEEGVVVSCITGHGGLFKTEGVGQRYLAAALNSAVTVMSTAGEGGAWGMAVLASYMLNKEEGETLSEFLDNKIFAGQKGETLEPDEADVKGFDEFAANYKACLAVERAAVDNMKM